MSESNSYDKFISKRDFRPYLDELNGHERLFRSISKSVQLKWEHIKEIDRNELPVYIDNLSDQDLKETMTNVRVIGQGARHLTTGRQDSSLSLMNLVVFEQRNDGQYNILVVQIKQTKKFNPHNSGPFGMNPIALGVAAGILTLNPAIGVGVGVATAAVKAKNKVKFEHLKTVEDFLFVYAIEMLSRQGIFTTSSDGIVELNMN